MCCTLKDCIFYSRSGKISHKLSLCWENIFCRSLEPSPNASFYFLLDLLAYPEFFGYIDLRQTFCTLMFHRNLNVGIGVSSTACQGCAYPCCASRGTMYPAFTHTRHPSRISRHHPVQGKGFKHLL